jgi:hypothetical protein
VPRSELATLVAVCVLAFGALACGPSQTPAKEVRGVVLEVQATSLTDLGSLVVRDQSGVTWRFEARGYRGESPSHLRVHMVQGLTVTVKYHEEQGSLVIDEITD